MRTKLFDRQERQLIRAQISSIEELTRSDPENVAELAQAKSQLEQIISDAIPTDLLRYAKRVLTQLEDRLPQYEHNANNFSFAIILPSPTDITHMRGMPAGGQEDQAQRLEHMANKVTDVQKQYNEHLILDTNQNQLETYWGDLFTAIKLSNEKTALELLEKIPGTDPILYAICLVHPTDYIKNIIKYCIQARNNPNNTLKLNSDIIFTPGTFEILVKDIATTLYCTANICLSFGLPTHHAFAAEGRGFCILNKTAVLIHQIDRTVYDQEQKVFVLGTDINRDNGLCDILMQGQQNTAVTHIDIFDSRVYPSEDANTIDKEYFERHHKRYGEQFGEEFGKGEQDGPLCLWKSHNYDYFTYDLSKLPLQGTEEFNPSLVYALDMLQNHLQEAQESEQQIMIIMPTGWDSHEHETAPCGKSVSGRMMSPREASKRRFTDNDLNCFYDRLFTLTKEFNHCISEIYWGLEGGYDQTMYEQQIEVFLTKLNQYFRPSHQLDEAEHSPSP